MARRGWREDEARLRAAATDDVIRVADLESLGVHSDVTSRRCRPGGPWQRMHRGVVLLHSGPPSWRQRVRSALVYGGSESQLTGSAGCWLHGLRKGPSDGSLHVLVPERTRRQSSGLLVVERTTRLPDPVLINGFATAPVARSVLDQCRRLTTATLIQALVAETVQRGYCTVSELVDELDAGSCRGSAMVRDVLEEITGGPRSVAELRAKRLHRRSGLPTPQWNVRLTDQHGSYVGTPDAWFDEVGLAWEIDSHEFHLEPKDHTRTLRRDNRYQVSGVEVHRTIPSHLTARPGSVITDLHAAYRAASLTPTPRLIATPV